MTLGAAFGTLNLQETGTVTLALHMALSRIDALKCVMTEEEQAEWQLTYTQMSAVKARLDRLLSAAVNSVHFEEVKVICGGAEPNFRFKLNGDATGAR